MAEQPGFEGAPGIADVISVTDVNGGSTSAVNDVPAMEFNNVSPNGMIKAFSALKQQMDGLNKKMEDFFSVFNSNHASASRADTDKLLNLALPNDRQGQHQDLMYSSPLLISQPLPSIMGSINNLEVDFINGSGEHICAGLDGSNNKQLDVRPKTSLNYCRTEQPMEKEAADRAPGKRRRVSSEEKNGHSHFLEVTTKHNPRDWH